MFKINNGFTVYDWEHRKARKQWVCIKCGKIIKPHEKYLAIRCSLSWTITPWYQFCDDNTLFDIWQKLTELINKQYNDHKSTTG